MQVAVHDVAQARGALAAAAAADRPIQLRSAADAAAYAGVGFLKALGDAVDRPIVVDCGDDPGLVMAALRSGCRRIAFSGGVDAARRLGDMAVQLGATLIHEEGAPEVLRLGPDDEATPIVRAALAGRSVTRDLGPHGAADRHEQG